MSETLPTRFESQVRGAPANVALTHGVERLTYAELNARANQLAHYLIATGVGPDHRVALLLPRSTELVVALLGVLKAGGAYVPIDPAYPAERIRTTLADAAPAFVLTVGDNTVPSAPAGSPAPTVIRLDDHATQATLARQPATNPDDGDRRIPLRPAHAAYVIYTSGSTGAPKGVVVTHDNVVALLDAALARFSFDDSDAWTLFHSYAFDFSVWEVWGPFSTGGRLVVVDREVTWEPAAFAQLLVDERVTVCNQTPSAFFALVAAERVRRSAGGAPLTLRTVVFGGEALDVARLGPWWEWYADSGPELVNMYGITETTVHVTWLAVDALVAASGGHPIGEPLVGLTVHVLDDTLRPVADGDVGEMYVGGRQVVRGYLGHPELTATRFVADPFTPGARLYRTGDLARRRAGGLEFIGRADGQVKVRGFRVELGEVEAVLASHSSVAQCAVAPFDDDSGTQLAAYVVPVVGHEGSDGIDAADLRAHCAARLPAHVVPAAFVRLDALPLTLNNKLDRRALPEPPRSGRRTAAAEQRRELMRRRLATR